MRVTSKGQVTIPIEVREKLGIFPSRVVEFHVQGNAARLMKVQAKRVTSSGASVLGRLKGSARVKMTTDKILALTRKSR